MKIGVPRFCRICRAALLLCASGWTALWGDSLKGGVAKVDITPPVGHQLWGNGNRLGASTGTIDPLYARILVLKSDASSLGIVTLDLGRTFDEEQMTEVRAMVKQQAGIDHVIFAASHTHTGPTLLNQQYVQQVKNRWEPKALDAISKSIQTISQNAVACRIGAGKGTAYIGHNRADPTASGRVLGSNETRIRTSPLDPVVQVLRVDDASGAPMAIVVNYACHPIILNSADSTQYSADFPGAMSEYVEGTLPGNPVCLFIQGAAGDIAPLYSGYSSTEKGSGGHGVMVREMRRLGRELGQEVVRVAGAIRTGDPKEAELQVVDDQMTFAARWDLARLKAMNATPTYHQWLTTGRPLGFPPDELKVSTTTVLINQHIAILTMPGEPYVDYQIDFRSRLPGLDTILAGYANGYAAYLPTIRAEVQYQDATWPAILEVGAGERIVDRGIINVYRMLGRLKMTTKDTKSTKEVEERK